MNMSLSDALRYSLPGGVFIAIALLIYPDLRTPLLSEEGRGFFNAAALLAIALLIGTLIQTAHRAFLYVFIVRLLAYLFVKRRGKFWEQLNICKLLPTEVCDYKRTMEFRYEHEFAYTWFRRWADQTHFLWATLWACVFARFGPGWFGLTPRCDFDIQLLVAAGVIAVLAGTDDVRHMLLERALWDSPPKKPPQKVNGEK